MSKFLLFFVICLNSALLTYTGGCKTETSNESGDEHTQTVTEESGERFALDQTHDAVRKGVRLILSYDQEAHVFTGTVENIT